MRITEETDDHLIIDCERTGVGFLSTFIGFGLFLALAGWASWGTSGYILPLLGGTLFVGVGMYGLWFMGPVRLILNRKTELATLTRQLPFRVRSETYSLKDIDDVTNARAREGAGYGLAIELVGGKVVRVTDANHHNPEARTVGKKIRTWLKTHGYR